MIVRTPLARMDAYTLAEEAISPGPNPLPPIVVRARVADALQRVDRASRHDANELVIKLLAALTATIADGGHYEGCLHGLRGGPPDDETRLGGARCSAVCVQVRKALDLVNPEDEPIERVRERLSQSPAEAA